MKEVELPVVQNGQYKNIYLTPNVKLGQKGLDPKSEEYIVVEKKFKEGREINGKFGVNFSCGVTYNEEDASFFLTPFQHGLFVDCGEEGDKIKVIRYLKESKTGYVNSIRFEKVE